MGCFKWSAADPDLRTDYVLRYSLIVFVVSVKPVIAASIRYVSIILDCYNKKNRLRF